MSETTATKQAYQISTGLWVVAECERCGRGFIVSRRVGDISKQSLGRDPYLPQEGSTTFGRTSVCGGRIVRLIPTEGSRKQEGWNGEHMSNEDTVLKTISAGTIVHLQGIPVRLKNDATVETTEGNWGLATQPLQPNTDPGGISVAQQKDV